MWRSQKKAQSLLKRLVTAKEEEKVEYLEKLRTLLYQNPLLKQGLLEMEEISRVISYLKHSNLEIVKATAHILTVSLNGSGCKRKLSAPNIFSVLKNYLNNDIDDLTISTLALISAAVKGNSLGQVAVRDSGCLRCILNIFYRNLQPGHSQVTEGELTCWSSLCSAVRACTSKPLNTENQDQAGLIIPKGIAFIGNWCQVLSNQCVYEKTKFLVPVLTSLLKDNIINQMGFSAYSGLQWIIRGLQAIAGCQSMPNLDNFRDRIVDILLAALENNPSNCEVAASNGAVPLLLFILLSAKDKHKLRPLLALGQLVINCSRSKEEFIKANGVTAIEKVNMNTSRRTKQAARRLLEYCGVDATKTVTSLK